MRKDLNDGFQEEAATALELMERALDLLDICPFGTDVGPHLDLAICRLRDLIDKHGPGRPQRS